MTPFCLGIAIGAALVAAVLVVGSHVLVEVADGQLAL